METILKKHDVSSKETLEIHLKTNNLVINNKELKETIIYLIDIFGGVEIKLYDNEIIGVNDILYKIYKEKKLFKITNNFISCKKIIKENNCDYVEIYSSTQLIDSGKVEELFNI